MGDDIDEEEDVWRLVDRLCDGHRGGGGQVVTCPYTLKTLIALGLVEKKKIMLTTMSVSTIGQEEGVVYVAKRWILCWMYLALEIFKLDWWLPHAHHHRGESLFSRKETFLKE